jgi:2-keto-3-deoxy-galactonokinase
MNDDIRLVAIDWGTSTARAYSLDAQGAVIAERSLPLGVSASRTGILPTLSRCAAAISPPLFRCSRAG